MRSFCVPSTASLLLLALRLFAPAPAAAVSGPVAQWDFDEGRGTVARDAGGNANHGAIYGAQWVPCGDGFALAFDGVDDYIDGGAGPSLDLRGPLSIEAWIHPAALPGGEAGVLGKFFESYLLTIFKDGAVWWYVSGGVNHVRVPLEPKRWQHVVGTFDGTSLRLYRNGVLRAEAQSRAATPGAGKKFLIGCTVSDPDADDPAYHKVARFAGMLDGVRVYDRALNPAEAAARFKADAETYGFDVSGLDRLAVTLYPYPGRGRLVVELDCSHFVPQPVSPRAEVTLAPAGGGPAVGVKSPALLPPRGIAEVTFETAELQQGEYLVMAALEDKQGTKSTTQTTFHHAAPEVELPSLAQDRVPPLPAAPSPPAFELTMGKGGGFSLRAAGRTFPVATRASWPNGGFNRLTAPGATAAQAEPEWTVATEARDAGRHEVRASGACYEIRRRVEVRADHVRVHDTYTNTGPDAVGILICNYLDARGLPFDTHRLGGWEMSGRKEEAASPSAFGGAAGYGFGMVPLDDVFVVQSVLYAEPELLGIGTEAFALAPGKSHTFEWAVYVTATGDYYDFLNAVRRNEDRIGALDGGVAMFTRGPFDRRNVPSVEDVALRRTKYGLVHCLSGAADDPAVSIEGIEYMDFPKEIALLKKQMQEVHARHPDMKVLIHVAHSLYATDRPERFADSRVIKADGSQVVWPDDGKYIKPERQQAGWQWWIFYPTPGNRFHDAMLEAVDVMLDDIGADGFFMDGFMWGYRSRWTYDRWDGVSADIDPETKTIRRKKGSVLLLSQPSLVEFARKVRDKGGVVMANNSVITRTIAGEKYILHDKELQAGPFLDLAPTLSALTDCQNIKAEKDIYLDALNKLKWGMTFCYYQEGKVTYASLPARQFPVTFEEVRSGLIKGPDRIITMNPGVHGWAGDRRLHRVFRFDSRGAEAAHAFVTTADADGVRTQLTLARNESAVIVPVPVRVAADEAVNALVRQYDPQGIRIVLNSMAPCRVVVDSGEFAVRPGTSYRIAGAAELTLTAGKDGRLAIELDQAGLMELTIRENDA